MVVVQNNVVYTQASMEKTSPVHVSNGNGPQLQKFAEWQSKTGPPNTMYVKNGTTINRNQVIDMRPRTRSISPTRYRQRGFERGRTSQRIVVPQQVVRPPNSNASVRVNTINRARIRSRSAPPPGRQTITYTTRVPQTTTGYTQSHFLAIKQPFSKKFLLPPVRVSQKFVPVGSQRVIVTKRPTVIPRPQPQPQQQTVIPGRVYHVQYNPDRSNTITRGVNALNLERSVNAATVKNGGQAYLTGGQQVITRQYSNGSSQANVTVGQQQYVTRHYNSNTGGVQVHQTGGQQQFVTRDYNSNNGGVQVYHTGGQQQFVTRLNSNSSGQGVQGRTVYTNRLSYNSDVFDTQGTYVRQDSNNGGYYVTGHNEYSPYVNNSQPAHRSHQNVVSLSEYTPKIMKTSFYQKRQQGWTFADNGYSSRPTSQVIEQQQTGTTKANGEGNYVYSQVIRTSEKTEKTNHVTGNANADEYTIIDYVGPETSSSTKKVTPMSTSTPRFADRDTSALDDLDNVLGKSGTSSSSSSDEN